MIWQGIYHITHSSSYVSTQNLKLWEKKNFLPSFKNWCIPVVYPSVKYVTTLQCNYSGVPISEICNYTAALPAQLNDDVTFVTVVKDPKSEGSF